MITDLNLTFTSPGLVPYIQKLGNNLIGCELGVCRAGNLKFMLDALPNISKCYAIDPWVAYQDWCGWQDQQLVDSWKNVAYKLMAPYGDRIQVIEKYSTEAANNIPDESLDYIFIDGDHSYEAVLNDCYTYWPKIKKGGIFAGHDRQLPGVVKAVTEFREKSGIMSTVEFVDIEVWFWYKE